MAEGPSTVEEGPVEEPARFTQRQIVGAVVALVILLLAVTVFRRRR